MTLIFWLLAILYLGKATYTFLSIQTADSDNLVVRLATSAILPLCDFMIATTVVSVVVYRVLDSVYQGSRGLTMWKRIQDILASL